MFKSIRILLRNFILYFMSFIKISRCSFDNGFNSCNTQEYINDILYTWVIMPLISDAYKYKNYLIQTSMTISWLKFINSLKRFTLFLCVLFSFNIFYREYEGGAEKREKNDLYFLLNIWEQKNPSPMTLQFVHTG